MSQIIVRRQKAMWQDIACDYVVLIDEKEMGRVGNGVEIDIPVELGAHIVQLKIDWCRSPKINLNVGVGEDVVLNCGPNANPFLVLIYVTFLRNSYLWLRVAK